MKKPTTIVNISDKYRVVIDEYNHTLQVLKEGGELNRRKGLARLTKDRWVDKGYHPTLQSVLRKVIEMEATELASEYKDLHSYMEVLNQLDLKYGCFIGR